MRKILILNLVLYLILTNVCLADARGIRANQIDTSEIATTEYVDSKFSGSDTINAIAGENLNANDIVKIINDGGLKAYKFLTQVATGDPTTITLKDTEFIDSIATTDNRATLLDANRFVVVWRGGGSNNAYSRVYILNPSTGELTLGNIATLSNANGIYTDVSKINATQVIAVYRDFSDGYGKAKIGTISEANEISWGAASNFIPLGISPEYIRVTTLSENKFAVSWYAYSTSKGSARVGAHSGGNIAWGNISDFSSYSIGEVDLTSLSTSLFAITYCDANNGNIGRAIVGIVDGSNNLTWGAANTFQNSHTLSINCSTLTSNKFIVSYRDIGQSHYGKARVGIVDGSNNLSWGNVSTFHAGGTTYTDNAALTSTKIVVSYADTANSNYLRLKVGFVDGSNNLSWGDIYGESKVINNPTSLISMSTTALILNFGNQSDTKGTTKSYKLIAESIYTGLIIPAFCSNSVGIDSAGEFAILSAGAKITGSTLSVSPFNQYYLDSNSAITTTVSANYYVGVGLSATELLIDGSMPFAEASASTPVALQRK